MFRKFAPNQSVGLIDDLEFVGVITAPLYSRDNLPTGKWVVGVSNPGKSVYRGQARIEEKLLVALSAPPAYSMAPKAKTKARILAPGHAPAELSR